MPPKRRTPALTRATKRASTRQEANLSENTTLDQLMKLSVPVLREQLKAHNVTHKGNKNALAQALLVHLQGQSNADEGTSPNDPTVVENNTPFTPAQQAALQEALQSALATVPKNTSPSLSDPSTSTPQSRPTHASRPG